MRLPRWLVITALVLSCVTAIGVPAYLWTVWPYQTAYDFLARVRDGRFDDAGRLLVEPAVLETLTENRIIFCVNGQKRWLLPPDFFRWWLRQEDIEFPPRSLSDWWSRRCEFRPREARCDFVVEHGTITVTSRDAGLDRLEVAFYEALSWRLRANWLKQQIRRMKSAEYARAFGEGDRIVERLEDELQRLEENLSKLIEEQPFLKSVTLR